MATQKKIRVMVLYGGRSGEHEVSLRSAASVIHHLDKQKFEILPVAIDKKGKWLLHDVSQFDPSAASLPILENSPQVVLPPHPGSAHEGLLYVDGSKKTAGIDVIFPVMHGTFCEDGTIQGLFELAEVPYVGCGVLSSSVGMDKDFSKRIVRDGGLPIVPFVTLRAQSWKTNKDEYSKQIAEQLGYPVFVKPSNSGSSVGVHKVKEARLLDAAVEDAFQYDSKVLVERGITAREIEFSLLENSKPGQPPMVSLPGEATPTHEFYSYEAKYLDDNGAKLTIPAKLDKAQIALGQKIAREAFTLLEGEGMARVDLFLDKQSGAFYFNEINTLPGFTSISMYPKMWEASGIGYQDLLTQLIGLALARHDRKNKLKRDFHV